MYNKKKNQELNIYLSLFSSSTAIIFFNTQFLKLMQSQK